MRQEALIIATAREADLAPLTAYPLAAVAMNEITPANADERFAFGLKLQMSALKEIVRDN